MGSSPQAFKICPKGTLLFGIWDLGFVISPEGGEGHPISKNNLTKTSSRFKIKLSRVYLPFTTAL